MNKRKSDHVRVAAIKKEGGHEYAQRLLDDTQVQLAWYREELLKQIAENVDDESMRREELERARRAYGLTPAVSPKP